MHLSSLHTFDYVHPLCIFFLFFRCSAEFVHTRLKWVFPIFLLGFAVSFSIDFYFLFGILQHTIISFVTCFARFTICGTFVSSGSVQIATEASFLLWATLLGFIYSGFLCCSGYEQRPLLSSTYQCTTAGTCFVVLLSLF